ncbi:hypothetical protein ACIBCC_03745 [Streptomyces griseus]|uniref:hypothetical protein n=1 Tax=Streptomyces griseus TaxID=1911 RepID=UPI00378FF661
MKLRPRRISEGRTETGSTGPSPLPAFPSQREHLFRDRGRSVDDKAMKKRVGQIPGRA